jgi:di/tricarboxylate transporter
MLCAMATEAWVVLGVLVGILAVLATDRVSPPLAMGGGLTVLLLVGAVDDDVVLSGLSSPATATIAALYVIAAAVSATGAMTWVVDRLLFGRRGGLPRLVGAIAGMSAFVPNTPLVALAAPRVVRWSRANGTSASRLLMPLSFASILGGVVTLLGTSTNLVVSDVLRAGGDEPLDVFEITPIGLPVAVLVGALLVLVAPRLLRERTPAGASMRATARAYQIQMVVEAGGPLDGVTIEQAQLRDLDGLFLAALERGDQLVAARPDARVFAGDRLYFVGDVGRVVDLQDIAGLVSAEQNHVLDAEGPGVRLYEAVVSTGSELAGRTLKEAGFRGRYGAAVLAVHRADDELRGKLGVIRLRDGDVLLVLAGPEFAWRWREFADFSLVASVAEPPPARRKTAWVAGMAFAAMVVLAATGVLSLFAASVVSAGFVVAGRALSLTEARRAVNLNVILTIAASISLGNAVATSGLAAEIGAQVVRLGEPLGAAITLYLVIVATQLITEVLSNSGAAALMVPVAMAAAPGVGGDPRDFAIGVLIGASCSFLTPIGYQTNLMVYGLGGYRFTDFTRVGLPLTVASGALATALLSW